MSTEKTTLEALLEGVNTGVLTEETKLQLGKLINETVEIRVKAKETLLTEEVDKLKAKLLTEAEDLQKRLLTEAEENEKVLVEQAEKYKKELEETLAEETIKFKESYEKTTEESLKAHKDELESMVLTEAKEFKTKQDAVLVEEVKKFKADMIDKVSDFLETKITEAIPAEIMESATKVAVLEPLVGALMEGFSKNFIKLDTTSYKLIKGANDRISTLETELQAKSKEEIKLKKEIKEVNRNMKIKSLTEGFNADQKEKAVKLLEGVEVEEMDSRFSKIRDIIIESSVKPQSVPVTKPVEVITESKTVVAKTEPKTTPIADKAVIDHQMKRILAESESKLPVSKPKVVNAAVATWASRIKPGYVETPK